MRYYSGELHRDTIMAIASHTQLIVNSYQFIKWLDGIQVGRTVQDIKVVLTCDQAVRDKLNGTVVSITKSGFFIDGKPAVNVDIMHIVLGDAGFRFGLRFRVESGRVYVN